MDEIKRLFKLLASKEISDLDEIKSFSIMNNKNFIFELYSLLNHKLSLYLLPSGNVHNIFTNLKNLKLIPNSKKSLQKLIGTALIDGMYLEYVKNITNSISSFVDDFDLAKLSGQEIKFLNVDFQEQWLTQVIESHDVEKLLSYLNFSNDKLFGDLYLIEKTHYHLEKNLPKHPMLALFKYRFRDLYLNENELRYIKSNEKADYDDKVAFTQVLLSDEVQNVLTSYFKNICFMELSEIQKFALISEISNCYFIEEIKHTIKVKALKILIEKFPGFDDIRIKFAANLLIEFFYKKILPSSIFEKKKIIENQIKTLHDIGLNVKFENPIELFKFKIYLLELNFDIPSFRHYETPSFHALSLIQETPLQKKQCYTFDNLDTIKCIQSGIDIIKSRKYTGYDIGTTTFFDYLLKRHNKFHNYDYLNYFNLIGKSCYAPSKTFCIVSTLEICSHNIRSFDYVVENMPSFFKHNEIYQSYLTYVFNNNSEAAIVNFIKPKNLVDLVYVKSESSLIKILNKIPAYHINSDPALLSCLILNRSFDLAKQLILQGCDPYKADSITHRSPIENAARINQHQIIDFINKFYSKSNRLPLL